MQRWEYLIVRHVNREWVSVGPQEFEALKAFDEKLAQVGAAGWELVTDSPSAATSGVELIFKRPVTADAVTPADPETADQTPVDRLTD